MYWSGGGRHIHGGYRPIHHAHFGLRISKSRFGAALELL